MDKCDLYTYDFGANEYVKQITATYSQWNERIMKMTMTTTLGKTVVMGKGTGTTEKLTFSLTEPFLGFYGLVDVKTKVVKELGVIYEKCTFKDGFTTV